MMYDELLKSESELAQEKAKATEQQLAYESEQVARNNWLQLNVTKNALKLVENQCLEVNDRLLKSSTNDEISSDQLRLIAVEAQTLRKTINLLKYARYSNSIGVNDTNK